MQFDLETLHSDGDVSPEVHTSLLQSFFFGEFYFIIPFFSFFAAVLREEVMKMQSLSSRQSWQWCLVFSSVSLYHLFPLLRYITIMIVIIFILIFFFFFFFLSFVKSILLILQINLPSGLISSFDLSLSGGGRSPEDFGSRQFPKV